MLTTIRQILKQSIRKINVVNMNKEFKSNEVGTMREEQITSIKSNKVEKEQIEAVKIIKVVWKEEEHKNEASSINYNHNKIKIYKSPSLMISDDEIIYIPMEWVDKNEDMSILNNTAIDNLKVEMLQSQAIASPTNTTSNSSPLIWSDFGAIF